MPDSTIVSGPLSPRQRSRRLVINRAPEPSDVQRRLESDRRRYAAGIVDPDQFAAELAVDFARRRNGGRNCGLASISIFEIPGIQHRYGPDYVFDRVSELVLLLRDRLAPNDVYHVAENGDVLVLGRDSSVGDTIKRVQEVCVEIARRRWDADGEQLLFTPSAGVATLDDADDAAVVVRRAIDAREVAAGHLDLRVHRWEPAMSVDTAPPDRQPFDRFGWQSIKERLRAPVQILATYVVGLVIPFCTYWFFDQVIGFDITWGVYLFCVATLVSTGVMILVEARLAIRQKEPPEVDSYPDASAIICAYLPNEAATIMDTVDAFLNQGYPGNLQVIVAYNTPNPMTVERELHALADLHPLLDVVKVEGSTSKAQNVNAVLHMATGEFTGMFDADHMPRPGSYERAWRWLANGYDVVQGHCMTRNGEETWLARMIAVEFESIYAVAHPGRAKLHRFGVFGGSNGYWRTELLHETRMRGSMLTEDIDSSMRTVERGLKIRSDRDVVSRELATTTMKQVWNQRLRWAQGWFQVTMMHALRVWRSPGLTFRQKFGATYLLGWREVYPWLSLQVFPLVAYWFVHRGDTLSSGWPFFFFTTVFVLHVGPHQTWYAYKLADPEIKQHKAWFWGYLLFSTVFYTEFKNTVARVAHIKEFVGERAWKVTPRSDAPVEFDDDADLFGDEPGAADVGIAPAGGDAAATAALRSLPRAADVPTEDRADRLVELPRRRLREVSAGVEGAGAEGAGVERVEGEPLLPSVRGEVDSTGGLVLPRRRLREGAVLEHVESEPSVLRRISESARLVDSVAALRETGVDGDPPLVRRDLRPDQLVGHPGMGDAGSRSAATSDSRPAGERLGRNESGGGDDARLPRRRRRGVGEEAARELARQVQRLIDADPVESDAPARDDADPEVAVPEEPTVGGDALPRRGSNAGDRAGTVEYRQLPSRQSGDAPADSGMHDRRELPRRRPLPHDHSLAEAVEHAGSQRSIRSDDARDGDGADGADQPIS